MDFEFDDVVVVNIYLLSSKKQKNTPIKKIIISDRYFTIQRYKKCEMFIDLNIVLWYRSE